MEIKLEDKKLAKLLKQKKETLEEGKKMSEEAKGLQAKLDKLKLKKDNLVAKIHDIVDKKDIELDEFIELDEVLLNDKGEIIVTTIDAIEEYKEIYRKRIKQQQEEEKK